MVMFNFYFGMMLVDDDQDIISQHEVMLDNRAFRRETPGRIYCMLRDSGKITAVQVIDDMIAGGTWPAKENFAGILSINPEIDDAFTVVEPDIAFSASEADVLWQQKSAELEGLSAVYIALLDHDMPEQTGLDLAEQWRPLEGGLRRARNSPLIIIYTGKAALLEEALVSDGIKNGLDSVTKTGLAEAVLQKGASNDEFNYLIWTLLEKGIRKGC